MIDFLRKDPRVVHAAKIAREFKQDPVAMLQDDGDELLMLIRIAAYENVMEDKRKEAEAERAAARKK